MPFIKRGANSVFLYGSYCISYESCPAVLERGAQARLGYILMLSIVSDQETQAHFYPPHHDCQSLYHTQSASHFKLG